MIFNAYLSEQQHVVCIFIQNYKSINMYKSMMYNLVHAVVALFDLNFCQVNDKKGHGDAERDS